MNNDDVGLRQEQNNPPSNDTFGSLIQQDLSQDKAKEELRQMEDSKNTFGGIAERFPKETEPEKKSKDIRKK
jgi:hypothetical protein